MPLRHLPYVRSHALPPGAMMEGELGEEAGLASTGLRLGRIGVARKVDGYNAGRGHGRFPTATQPASAAAATATPSSAAQHTAAAGLPLKTDGHCGGLVAAGPSSPPVAGPADRAEGLLPSLPFPCGSAPAACCLAAAAPSADGCFKLGTQGRRYGRRSSPLLLKSGIRLLALPSLLAVSAAGAPDSEGDVGVDNTALKISGSCTYGNAQ